MPETPRREQRERDSRIVHLRISDRTLCGILDFCGAESRTLSGAVATFCDTLVQHLREQGVVAELNPDFTATEQLQSLLVHYNMAVEVGGSGGSGEESNSGAASQDSPRDHLRNLIKEAEQRVVQPATEESFYDFEHGPGLRDIDRVSQSVERPAPDLYRTAKLSWDFIETTAPLDRYVVSANSLPADDPGTAALKMTIRIVYKQLAMSSWGGAVAEKLIRETMPRVVEGLKNYDERDDFSNRLEEEE